MLDELEVEGEDAEESQSWFDRVRSGSRTLSAAALFLGALVVLFWNESYSKRHSDALDEVAAQVQTAGTALDPQLDGKPVHLSARVHSQAGASDPVFAVRTDGVALYRHVEIFQWIEEEETSGRGRKKKTTYSYAQGWDWEYHDSRQFHEPKGHENPKPALESDGFFAADATFGPYRFDNKQVAEQAIDESDTPDAPGSLGDWPVAIEQLPELSSALTAKRWYTLEPGVYYRGNQDAEEPQLGDLHVSFYALANDYALSMLAGQQGDHLLPWRASNGDEILLAASGQQSAKQLISLEVGASAAFTKLVRIGGLIAAVIGAAGMATWLGGFLTAIPVVGRLVEMSLFVAGALFGLVAGLLTIVIGWFAARPWIAAVLLLSMAAAVVWAIRKGRVAAGELRRSKRATALAASAKERAAKALDNLVPPSMPPGLAAAGPAGVSPPSPPVPPKSPALGSLTPTKRVMPVPPPPAPAPAEESKELPPLEWTPGLISSKPAAVRPRAEPTAPPAAPPAPASAAGPTPKAPPAMPAAAPPRTAPPLFDTVPTRQASQPLFDTVPLRDTTPPLFDTVPPRDSAPPLFDTVPLREDSMPQFELPPAPAFGSVSQREAPIDAPAAAPKNLRIALGSKGDYALSKIVRQHADGAQEVLCFELAKAGKPIKRGSQDEVKEALRLALSGGGA